jgi:hypothetical protein
MKIVWYSSSRLSSAMLERLKVGLLQEDFARDSSSGFRIEQARGAWIEGKFFEKIDFIEALLDPFGNRIEIPRVRFDVVSFRISTAYPEIEIKQPPRSLKTFFSHLARITNFSISIERIDLRLMRLIEALGPLASNLEVRSLTVENFSIAEGITGRIFIKGVRDIRREARDYLRNRNSEVRKAGVTIAHPSAHIDLFSSGRANIATDEDDEVSEILRKAIRLANRDSVA